jgi:spore coat protein A
MRSFKWKWSALAKGASGPATDNSMGYNGSSLGLRSTPSGQALNINWVSKLPTTHLFPIDHSIHGAESTLPLVRNVSHVHGACALPDDDGYPEAWFTAHGERGPKFNPRPSLYSNCQPSTTLWYHDHALGITRLNVYAGLAGFYLIRDEAEGAELLKASSNSSCCKTVFHRDGSFTIPRSSMAKASDLDSGVLR